MILLFYLESAPLKNQGCDALICLAFQCGSSLEVFRRRRRTHLNVMCIVGNVTRHKACVVRRQFFGDTLLGEVYVRFLGVIAHISPLSSHCSNCRSARTDKRVKHQVVFVGVEVNQPLRKLDGKRCRMPYTSGILGGDVPNIQRSFHELISTQPRVAVRQSISASPLRRLGPIEAAFACNHDALRYITQNGVGRAPERPPSY